MRMSARRKTEKERQNRIHGRLRLGKTTVIGHVTVPAGAIPANYEKQAPNNSYGPPAYYADLSFRCFDCGKEEVWTAEQQHWWYEIAKGPIQSTAVRCRACRRRWRQARDEQRQRSAAGRERKGKGGA